MKVILEFDTSTIEGKDELYMAMKGPDLFFTVKDVLQELRNKCKYENNDSAGELRTRIYELATESDINLDI